MRSMCSRWKKSRERKKLKIWRKKSRQFISHGQHFNISCSSCQKLFPAESKWWREREGKNTLGGTLNFFHRKSQIIWTTSNTGRNPIKNILFTVLRFDWFFFLLCYGVCEQNEWKLRVIRILNAYNWSYCRVYIKHTN